MAVAFSVAPTTGTGTISISRNGTVVTGNGTNFTGQVLAGKRILVNGFNALVSTVTSATSMTISGGPPYIITNASFSFVPNGTYINLTGTENDVISLGALAGIYYRINGSGIGIMRECNIGDFQLRISGTFNQNPETDSIAHSLAGFTSGRGVEIVSGGHWNYGSGKTSNGVTTYTSATGYFNSYVAINGYQFQWLVVRGGGKLTHRGGVFEVSSGITFEDGAIYDQYDGAILLKNNIPMSMPIITATTQANADLIVIRDLTLDCSIVGGVPLLNPNGSFSPSTLNINLKSAGVRDSKTGSSALPISNFKCSSNAADYDIAFETTNSADYHAQQILGYDKTPRYFRFGAGGSAGGISELRRIIRHEFIDTNGASVNSAVYFTEKNNGNRRVVGTFDYSASITTVLATSNGAVESNVITQVASAVLNVNLGVVNLDKRYNLDDTLTIHAWAYGYTYDFVDVPYVGLDKLTNKRTRQADTNVTLSEASATELTIVSHLDDLYDLAKLWKSQAVKSQLEYPTINTQPIIANGKELDLGAINLVVSPTATNAFVLNTATHTITIKSVNLGEGTKFKTIKTTGTVTGAISAGYTDANSNSYLKFEAIESWKVFSNELRTNQLGAGVSTDIFPFGFVPSTKYYLTVIANGTQFLMEVVPTTIGQTVVTLTTQALIVALTNKTLTLPQIEASTVLAKKTQLEVMNEGLKLLSNFEPYDEELM